VSQPDEKAFLACSQQKGISSLQSTKRHFQDAGQQDGMTSSKQKGIFSLQNSGNT
jgi:hypothetical protein